MIDDEGNGIGLVAPVDSGRCGAIGESHSSTTAAPPAARPDAPQGAALESAPRRVVACPTIRWSGTRHGDGSAHAHPALLTGT